MTKKLLGALALVVAVAGLSYRPSRNVSPPETERPQPTGRMAPEEADAPGAESSRDWFMKLLTPRGGEIDLKLLNDANLFRTKPRGTLGSTKPGVAGLPAPAGWTNVVGYPQSSGRINDILILPGTPTTMFAGADGGGVWKTTNSGTTWTPVNDFLGSLVIGNFAMATNDANTIYAGTNPRGSHTYNPGGVLKSTNQGATWTQLSSTNPGTNAAWQYVTRIAVHPTNSNIVLAATNSGAFQSIDGGANWMAITTGVAATFVAMHPTNGNFRAVASDNGTVRYTTTGDLVSGSSTVTVLASGRYMKLAYAASNTAILGALITDSGTGNSRVFRSTTSGAAWTEPVGPGNVAFYNGSYLSYTGALWIDPINPIRMAVCEGWCAFTADITAGAPTWLRLYSGWTDFHSIVSHPGYNGTSNKTVFFTDDGGVYRVTDIDLLNTFGVFTRLEQGLTPTELYSVSANSASVPIFGAQDVGPRVHRSGLWQFVANTAGGSWIGDGTTTAASPTATALYGSRQYLEMFRSTDGGVNATSIVAGSALADGRGASSPNYNAAFVAPFVLDPSNASRMFAAGNSIWRSDNVDTGSPPTWIQIRAPYVDPSCGTVQQVYKLEVAPTDSNLVLATYFCAGRVFKTTNALAGSPTWTEVTGLPGGVGFRSAMMIDQSNTNNWWIGFSNYSTTPLAKSINAGVSWTSLNAAAVGLPPAPINVLTQHPANSQWIYAGTAVGLFASEDGGVTWFSTNAAPANVAVTSLHFGTLTGQTATLHIGTFGRGAWRADISAVAATAPVLAAATASGVTATTATLDGNVTGDGGSAVSERGFVYATTAANSNPLIGGASVTKVVVAGTTGAFSTALSSLPVSTAYSFKAYAINAIGTTYSAVANFTTNAPSLSINDVNVTEGNSGSVNATFTVTLSAVSGQTVTVSAATADSTAIAPGDYTATGPTTLTFSPGVTTRTFLVPVLGDLVPEADETFSVSLTAPGGATISDGLGIGTIINDDVPTGPGTNARAIAVNSSAQNSLGGATPVVWYRAALLANRSYQISAWPTKDEGATGGVTISMDLFSDAAGTVPASPAALGTSGALEGSPNDPASAHPRTLIFQPTTPGDYRIRVTGGGATQEDVNLLLRETTLFSPWFFVVPAAAYESFHTIHNNTANPITVTLRAFDSTGGTVGNATTFSLPGNATVFKTAGGDLATGQANGGTVLTHSGAFGAVSGNTTTLSGVTGLSFDSPFTARSPSVLGLPVR